MAGLSYCRQFLQTFGHCRQKIVQRQVLLAKQRFRQSSQDSAKVLTRLEENEPSSQPRKIKQPQKTKRLQSPSVSELLDDHTEPSSDESTLIVEPDIDTVEFVSENVETEDRTSDHALEPELSDLHELMKKKEKSSKKEIPSKTADASKPLTSKIDVDKLLESDNVEKLTQKPGKTMYWKTQIDLINRSNSAEKVENILNYNVSKKMDYIEKNTIVVCALKRLERLGIDSLTEESERNILKHLNHKIVIGSLKIADIANMLSFFLSNSKTDSELAFTLLHEACWRLRKTSVRDTLAMLKALKNRQTEKRKETYEHGKKRLVENIDSISSPEEMLSVMYLLLGTPDIQVKVEAEASVMLPSMDPIQTYRLLYLLALNKSKNSLLINKARKHLCSRPISLDVQKLQNLFFACGVLKIQDKGLLQEMSENALDLMRDEEVSTDINFAVQLLISSSRLGWNYKPLTTVFMHKVGDFLSQNKKIQNQVPSIVTSVGHLNLTEYADLALSLMDSSVALKQTKPGVWLNVVHSLACLGKCDTSLAEDILKPEFYRPLLDSFKGKPDFIQQDVKRQLLNMYGYLSKDLEIKDSSFASVASEWRDQLQQQMKGTQLVGLAKAVSAVLTELAPLDKYCNTNVVSKYGYVIDFEIYVDETLKAVKLEKTDGMSRVWIKMLDFGNFVRGSEELELTGSTAMALRHLKSEENTYLIFVPYTDWGKIDKKLDHLNYLENKIKMAINPESANTAEGE